MKLGLLFSGGKDSTYAGYLAKKEGYEISCLITVYSKNPDSYMFHTPSILNTKKQAEVMGLPILIQKTLGEKEDELEDLKKAIKKAIKKYKIQGIVTGAVESVYQSSRIQKICSDLRISCFNPLWKKNQLDLLKEIVKNKFEVILVGVAGYPLDKSWLGRRIDNDFINEVSLLYDKYSLNPAGEGGEFESFVLNCPLFNKSLKILSYKDTGRGHSWRRELKFKN